MEEGGNKGREGREGGKGGREGGSDDAMQRELAPVLEGSGSRRRYPLKGRSVERVSVVFVARVDRRILLLFVKN